MNSNITGTSLEKYGEDIYCRDHYTCVYCGYDGRTFDAWMQLSIDHIRPKSCGGLDEADNLVVACRGCNSITSRMKFPAEMSREEIINLKRSRVKERRRYIYDDWLKRVAPKFLDRPLPKVQKY